MFESLYLLFLFLYLQNYYFLLIFYFELFSLFLFKFSIFSICIFIFFCFSCSCNNFGIPFITKSYPLSLLTMKRFNFVSLKPPIIYPSKVHNWKSKEFFPKCSIYTKDI